MALYLDLEMTAGEQLSALRKCGAEVRVYLLCTCLHCEHTNVGQGVKRNSFCRLLLSPPRIQMKTFTVIASFVPYRARKPYRTDRRLNDANVSNV
jgi:hypothetical protein